MAGHKEQVLQQSDDTEGLQSLSGAELMQEWDISMPSQIFYMTIGGNMIQEQTLGHKKQVFLQVHVCIQQDSPLEITDMLDPAEILLE